MCRDMIFPQWEKSLYFTGVYITIYCLLFFKVKPSVQKNASEIRMIISASDSVYLSCAIIHSNPEPTLTWWNQTCPEDSSECKPSLQGWGRMITDNTSSLEQVLIPPSHRHALFKCTAENWLGYDDVTYHYPKAAW